MSIPDRFRTVFVPVLLLALAAFLLAAPIGAPCVVLDVDEDDLSEAGPDTLASVPIVSACIPVRHLRTSRTSGSLHWERPPPARPIA